MNKRINIPSDRGKLLARLESDIAYRFTDRGLLAEALTHPSTVRPSGGCGESDYQRLEFLGDSVLSLIVSGKLLELFPECGEGDLSRMRASLVDMKTLAALAEGLRLGRLLLISRSEEKIGGRYRKSVLADTFEALAGAVYLDGGIACAERFVEKLFGPLLVKMRSVSDVRDHKTRLQELAHSMRCRPPLYLLNDVAGPEHDLLFTVTVIVGDQCFGRGTGKSRKEAEQDAARQGYELLLEDRARMTENRGR